MQIALTYGILLAAIVLFATERFRADVVALLVLAALMLFKILPASQAFTGFSSPATVTVACMFVLSAGLQASGLVRYLGDRLLADGPRSEVGLLALIAVVIGPISAFINNTAAVAIFLPTVMRVCQGKGISPSRILMPMAFFAILGGTCTLIGTSTNILVSSMAAARGVRPFRMFEFAPVGLILFATGAVYLLLVGRRLLPERVAGKSLTESYHLKEYLSEVVVLPGSPWIGASLAEARLGERHGLELLGLVREGHATSMPTDQVRLEEGDLLLVQAPAPALLRLSDSAGIAIKAKAHHPGDSELLGTDGVLVEAVILPNSMLDGRTVRQVDFRRRFGATMLAIRRHGEDICEKLGGIRLSPGDELLILTRRSSLERLREQNDLVVLQELDVPRLRPGRAVTAAAIIAGVVGTAALGFYPVAVSAVVGCVLMVLTRCLSIRAAYEAVDWKVVFLLAGVIPLGIAMETTGAASVAVEGMVWLLSDWGPTVMLGAFFLMTYALTGFISNNATAAVMVPLALTVAPAMGVDARPFIVAITFAASAAFYTPIGYQTNVLVYGPGGYRFLDYTRVGGPLNLLFWVVGTFAIRWIFPF